jgi:hypothetical protein
MAANGGKEQRGCASCTRGASGRQRTRRAVDVRLDPVSAPGGRIRFPGRRNIGERYSRRPPLAESRRTFRGPDGLVGRRETRHPTGNFTSAQLAAGSAGRDRRRPPAGQHTRSRRSGTRRCSPGPTAGTRLPGPGHRSSRCPPGRRVRPTRFGQRRALGCERDCRLVDVRDLRALGRRDRVPAATADVRAEALLEATASSPARRCRGEGARGRRRRCRRTGRCGRAGSA